MGFLVITCIGSVNKFLGIIPLRIAMIIMGALTIVCGGYNYLEGQVFFQDTKAFGLVNNKIYSIIQGVIGLLLMVDFFVSKTCYTIILYLMTIFLVGATLSYNIFKVSIFNDKIKDYEVEHHLIQFMFCIRIGAEFFVQLVVCYITYSFKKSL